VSGSSDTASGGLSKQRIEALADGIFAVAMTLLVLDIKMPDTVTYATDADLWQRLLGLEHAVASYAISFVILSVYWVSHHFLFHFIARTDRGLLWINLYLLLCITLVPFTTDLVGDNVHLRLPPLLYGVNLLLISAAYIAQVEYLRRRPDLAAPEYAGAVRLIRQRIALFTAIPILSMATTFYSPRLALYLYLTLPLIQIAPSRLDSLTTRSSANPRRS
jgi:TMEM175 potassium channel family protein